MSYSGISAVVSTKGCTLRKSCSSSGVSRMFRSVCTGAYTTFSMRLPSGVKMMSSTSSHLPPVGLPLGSSSSSFTVCR